MATHQLPHGVFHTSERVAILAVVFGNIAHGALGFESSLLLPEVPEQQASYRVGDDGPEALTAFVDDCTHATRMAYMSFMDYLYYTGAPPLF